MASRGGNNVEKVVCGGVGVVVVVVVVVAVSMRCVVRSASWVDCDGSVGVDVGGVRC